MDFARTHEEEQGITIGSKISIVPTDEKEKEQSSLDQIVIQASNKAAKDLFLGSNPNADPRLADSQLYPEHVLPTSTTIEAHALVVIFESFDNLNFVYATPTAIFNNRNGHFYHDDFIGKPFGCKIRSRNNGGLGFVYLLRPTPELWAKSLKHRTQIVHELDASMIVFYLNLRPNMVVCESGTGSGAMSHSILRTIAPKGMLHTYEFNRMRANHAREEFVKNKVDHLVTVHHHDVCGKSGSSSPGGFVGLGSGGGQVADAVFLDLPEPWLAVPHAAFALKPSGRIASYSPCVEQSQRSIEAMSKAGFHSVRTIEVRLREHFVDEVELELPPTAKMPKVPPHTVSSYTKPSAVAAEQSGNDTGAEADTELTEGEAEDATKNDVKSVNSDNKTPENPTTTTGKRKRMLCARPFTNMRGHTAFLTFATAGNKIHPDPNVATL